jgi:hypothetical protein
MIRYTVTYSQDALSALAREWLAAADRSAVTVAGDEVERQLAIDATNKGEEVREGLRRLVVPPLRVQVSVEEQDRTVTIWSVRSLPAKGSGS